MKGNFTVEKCVSILQDQAHEQINKSVKVNGGAVGILDNDNALLEWSTASPVITEILEKFNDGYQLLQGNATKHHEDKEF